MSRFRPSVSARRAIIRTSGTAGCLLALASPIAATAQTVTPATELAKPAPAAIAARPQATVSLAELAAQLETSPDTVVAAVNGTPITAGMVADYMRDLSPNLAALPASMIYERSLDDVIQQRSLAVKARELGLDKRPEAQRRIAETTDHTLANMLIHHLLSELVTEKAIRAEYDATVAGKPGAVEVQLRVIAALDEDTANAALQQLRNGAEFAKVAHESSVDATGPLGGEVGFTTRGRLTPEIGAVAFALMPGQMTQFPVLSADKWFIVSVEGRRQQGAPTLEAARPELTAKLTRDAAVEIIKKTRAAVVVNDYGPTGMRNSARGAVTGVR
jgi:peptidyl-prolyl cis-trans isomerase C